MAIAPWPPPLRPIPEPKPRRKERPVLGVEPTRPPPPPPPYPNTILIVARCTDLTPCSGCAGLPELWGWRTPRGFYVGYYLRCGKCGKNSVSRELIWRAADAWNAAQAAKVKPGAVLTSPASLSEETKRKLREERERSNWGPGLPAKGDMAAFSRNKRIAELHVEGGSVDSGKRLIEKLREQERMADDLLRRQRAVYQRILDGIVGEGDTAWGSDGSPLHLRQRFRKWLDRPGKPKPFLKPSREHWWQFWLQTDAQFTAWLDKRVAARKRKRRAA